jgi:hypothetical protein
VDDAAGVADDVRLTLNVDVPGGALTLVEGVVAPGAGVLLDEATRERDEGATVPGGGGCAACGGCAVDEGAGVVEGWLF